MNETQVLFLCLPLSPGNTGRGCLGLGTCSGLASSMLGKTLASLGAILRLPPNHPGHGEPSVNGNVINSAFVITVMVFKKFMEDVCCEKSAWISNIIFTLKSRFHFHF